MKLEQLQKASEKEEEEMLRKANEVEYRNEQEILNHQIKISLQESKSKVAQTKLKFQMKLQGGHEAIKLNEEQLVMLEQSTASRADAERAQKDLQRIEDETRAVKTIAKKSLNEMTSWQQNYFENVSKVLTKANEENLELNRKLISQMRNQAVDASRLSSAASDKLVLGCLYHGDRLLPEGFKTFLKPLGLSADDEKFVVHQFIDACRTDKKQFIQLVQAITAKPLFNVSTDFKKFENIQLASLYESIFKDLLKLNFKLRLSAPHFCLVGCFATCYFRRSANGSEHISVCSRHPQGQFTFVEDSDSGFLKEVWS